MKYNQLSGYARFLLLAEQTNGLAPNLQAYLGFKDVLKILEECSKSDTPSIVWKSGVVSKPVNRAEAARLLDKINNNKWDPLVRKVAHCFNIELR
jgi:hypothetical protein